MASRKTTDRLVVFRNSQTIVYRDYLLPVRTLLQIQKQNKNRAQIVEDPTIG